MTSYIEVKEALRSRITDGSWATGTKLPPERGLAEEFGASRNTIRKAIKLLAAENFLSTTENSRPVVSYVGRKGPGAGNGRSHDSEAAAFDSYILDASPIEVLEARLVIEPEA